MKDCVFIREKLSEFILNEIDESNAKKVNDHLTECAPCRSQLSEINELYRFGEKVFTDLRNSFELPPQLGPKLEESIMDIKPPSPFRQNLRFKGMAVSILIMLLFLSTYVSPTAAYYGSKIPILGRVFSVVDEGALIAHEEGFGQRVGKSVTVNGFTLVIDEVIVDKTRTLVVYRIKVPKGNKYEGGIAEDIVLKDQLGFSYSFSGGSGQGLPESDEVIGTAEFSPLKSWVTKLTFRTTTLSMSQGNQSLYQLGSWEIKFNVDPFLAKRVTREIKLNKKMTLPEGELLFTKVVMAPSQTTVLYEYEISGTDPRKLNVGLAGELLRNVKLRDSGGAELPKLGRNSGGMSSSSTGIKGQGELHFGPLIFGDYEEAVLQGEGFSLLKEELNVRIPLDFGVSYPKKIDFMDGKISIEKAVREPGGITVQLLTGVDKVNAVISAYLEVSGKKYKTIGIEEVDKKPVEKAGDNIAALVQELRFPAIDIQSSDKVVLVVDEAIINMDQPWQIEIQLRQEGVK